MIIDKVSDKICMRQFKNWSKYSNGIIHNTPWKMWRTRQIPVPDASSYLTIRIIFTHLASLPVVSRTRSNVLLWSCPQIALGSFNKVFQADILLVYWRGHLSNVFPTCLSIPWYYCIEWFLHSQTTPSVGIGCWQSWTTLNGKWFTWQHTWLLSK